MAVSKVTDGGISCSSGLVGGTYIEVCGIGDRLIVTIDESGLEEYQSKIAALWVSRSYEVATVACG